MQAGLKALHYFIILVNVLCAQAYKQARWGEIKRLTESIDHTNPSILKRFLYSVVFRRHEKDEARAVEKLVKEQLKKNEKKQLKQSRRIMYGSPNKLIAKARANLNSYMPMLVMTLLRIFLTLQAYMYNRSLGMVHLFWVLWSFIFPYTCTQILTITLLLPLYLSEFVMIYGMRVPILKDTRVMVNYKQVFDINFQLPILEQSLFFVVLVLIFMTISCLKLTYDQDQTEFVKQSFFYLIQHEKGSIFWKFLWFLFKHIQTLILVLIFLKGASNINTFKNLGFMIFFVIYTSSPYLYRKTCRVLILFTAFFILGQYYLQLGDTITIAGSQQEKLLYWLNLKPKYERLDGGYFSNPPSADDWVLMVLMSTLNLISSFYAIEKEEKSVSLIAWEAIRNRYFNIIMKMVRIKNFFGSISIFIALGILIYFIGNVQTNLISWYFFSLNLINLAFIAKADQKPSTRVWIRLFTSLLKFSAAFFLILEILFIILIGAKPKLAPAQHDSLDRKFAEMFPIIYNNLDIIGLRIWIDPTAAAPDENYENSLMKIKFFSYIAYLMVSSYLGRTQKEI